METRQLRLIRRFDHEKTAEIGRGELKIIGCELPVSAQPFLRFSFCSTHSLVLTIAFDVRHQRHHTNCHIKMFVFVMRRSSRETEILFISVRRENRDQNYRFSSSQWKVIRIIFLTSFALNLRSFCDE